MMRTIAIPRSARSAGYLATMLIACVSGVASAAVAAPDPPIMSLDDGKMLVDLARGGMEAFVKSRTAAGEYPVPQTMKHLTTMFHPAAVTLRSEGELLGRSFRADTNVCRSVLAAALDAMRSSKLPDRVTPSVLAALTVEVEVQGAAKAVSPKELDACVIRGLTGVKVSRGGAKGYILPSAACQFGLSAEQSRALCLAQLPQAGGDASRAEAWSIFNSKHYVGYPDGMVVQLFRGKILLPRSALTAEVLAEAAVTAGLFLTNAQDSSGMYATPDRKPALHEHLYATYAMAKLSRLTGKKLFAVSAERALEYAAKFVLTDEKQARVLAGSSAGRSGESPTRATAWLLMTITELPADDASGKLAAKLAGALQQDVVSIVRGERGMATPDQLLDWSTALMALRKFLPKNDATAKLLDPMHKTMQTWSKSGQKLSPRVFRGIGGATTLPKWRQIDDSDLPDRRGGFISSPSEPTTLETAIAAVCMARGLESAKSMTDDDKAAVNKQILRARGFCWQMLYRSREAYWSARPLKIMGALRVSPSGANFSIEACAAAIEAFLLK